MAVKKKIILEEEDDEVNEVLPKKKAKKKEPEESPAPSKAKGSKAGINPYLSLSEAMKKEKGENYNGNVFIDPDAPIITALFGYIPMDDWWELLSGITGIPYGHIVVIQGLPDCGKTTIAMLGMISAQKKGDIVVLLDSEFKFNWNRFKQMGGDISKVYHVEGETVEEVFEDFDLVKAKIEKDFPKHGILFVWDSLGMTPTRSEMEGKKDQATAARTIKRCIRTRISKIHKRKIAFVIVNHVYAKMNAMFGDATVGYGGNGAYFAAVLVLEVRKIMGKKAVKGGLMYDKWLEIKVKTKKNHIGPIQGRTLPLRVLADKIEVDPTVQKQIDAYKTDQEIDETLFIDPEDDDTTGTITDNPFAEEDED